MRAWRRRRALISARLCKAQHGACLRPCRRRHDQGPQGRRTTPFPDRHTGCISTAATVAPVTPGKVDEPMSPAKTEILVSDEQLQRFASAEGWTPDVDPGAPPADAGVAPARAGA